MNNTENHASNQQYPKPVPGHWRVPPLPMTVLILQGDSTPTQTTAQFHSSVFLLRAPNTVSLSTPPDSGGHSHSQHHPKSADDTAPGGCTGAGGSAGRSYLRRGGTKLKHKLKALLTGGNSDDHKPLMLLDDADDKEEEVEETAGSTNFNNTLQNKSNNQDAINKGDELAWKVKHEPIQQGSPTTRSRKQKLPRKKGGGSEVF
jgi:hypothetical protein